MKSQTRHKMKAKVELPPIKFHEAVQSPAKPAIQPGYTVLRPCVQGDSGYDVNVPKALIRQTDGTEQYVPVSVLPPVH